MQKKYHSGVGKLLHLMRWLRPETGLNSRCESLWFLRLITARGTVALANNWSIGGCTRHTIEVRQYFLWDLKAEPWCHSHQVEKWRRHAQWFVYQELGSEEFWKNMLPSLFVRIVAYVTKTAACCQHDTNTTHQHTTTNKNHSLQPTDSCITPPPPPPTLYSHLPIIIHHHASSVKTHSSYCCLH